jgi:acyl-CoA reductase-like NAD-dependent aldehyde dehydrogenase
VELYLLKYWMLQKFQLEFSILVNGMGPIVGAALSEHQDIDMMHFTGSTRAGVAVAIASAPTVKRVAQELGGKSANIILDDADIEKAASCWGKSLFYEYWSIMQCANKNACFI